MNSTDNTAIEQQKKPPCWLEFRWLTEWLKALDYSAYEHTSVTISELAESITTLEKRVIALERYEEVCHQV